MSVTYEYIGIDVGKAYLDIACGQDGDSWREKNNEAGIAKVVDRVKGVENSFVVVEATGGLELPLVLALAEAEQPFCRAHPGRVREFARAIGFLAKTDTIDARLLARFGEGVAPRETTLPSADARTLSAQLTRRRQLIEMVTAEKNRQHTVSRLMREQIQRHIDWLQSELDDLDKHIDQAVAELPVFRDKHALLTSVPGIGRVTAATFIADLPELGRFSRKQIASIVGVAPFNKDSGRRRGKRAVKGGRSDCRKMLYMATLSATRFNPIIRPFYQQLTARGKPFKVALVACMRKLLTILNAIIRDNQAWEQKSVAIAP
jgi:transposase